MKFRTFALTAAVAAVASFLPATAMAASAATAAPPPVVTGTGASTSTGPGGAAAAASSRNNINVEVVTQLPRDIYWKGGALYDRTQELRLPDGYAYRDGGVVGANDSFYFAPAGGNRHEGVVVAPMRCEGGRYSTHPVQSGNWIGSIVDSALKACAGVYDAAYNIIEGAVGGGNAQLYGGRC